MNDKSLDDINFPMTPVDMNVSVCCQTFSITDLYEDDNGNLIGVCAACKETTIFEPEPENER